MVKKINLSPELLLKKKFLTDLSGYSPSEVDDYLDQVIKDYQNFNEQIDVLESKLTEKQVIIEKRDTQIQSLKLQIANLKAQLHESNKASNYEILKRLDELTKANK